MRVRAEEYLAMRRSLGFALRVDGRLLLGFADWSMTCGPVAHARSRGRMPSCRVDGRPAGAEGAALGCSVPGDWRYIARRSTICDIA
jgi:hypothetical protein